MTVRTKNWFQGSVVYQIYPRSFMDSNGDGVGDINGIISKLDYLGGAKNSLNVDAVWISPMYKSPMLDAGYDITDHCAIDPLFGTMADFHKLLFEVHDRDMKLIMDFVPNHVSVMHEWFIESRSSRDSAKRDWFTWKDPAAESGPPNNWVSQFGGSAWEYDKQSGQYYLHTFLKEQPDLNWENPEVRAAMHNVMRYWLDMGVDGFRMDAIYFLAKDPELRNDPPNPQYRGSKPQAYDALLHTNSQGQPKLYTYLKEMTKVSHEYDNRFIVTEAYPENNNESAYESFYRQVDPTQLAPFNFDAIGAKWQAADFKRFVDNFQAGLCAGDVAVYAFGNHDEMRIVSRYGRRPARAAAVIQLSLPGTPFVYYGEELGMQNVHIRRSLAQDPLANKPDSVFGSRDAVRTPMQWSRDSYAEFSHIRPWLPVSSRYRSINVATESGQTGSMLQLYHDLIDLRKNSVILREGAYVPIATTHAQVFAFKRVHRGKKLLIICNMSVDAVKIHVDGEILLSSIGKKAKSGKLAADEARIISLATGAKIEL